MRPLASIKSEYYEIAKRLNAPGAHVRFATTPQHDGSPHIERIGNAYAYIITERGEELERRKTRKDDDVLYWLVSDLTWEMASRHELAHRTPHVDFRRLLFQKQLDLLGDVNCKWKARKKTEHAEILLQHPFHDEVAE